MKSIKNLIPLFSFLIILLIGCKKDDIPNPSDGNEEVELADNTQIINEETNQTLISSDNNELVFEGSTEQLKDIETGDFLVSGPVEEVADYGYLKKVIAIQEDNGKYTFQVEDAQLTDVIENGTVSFKYNITPQDTFVRGSNFTDTFDKLFFDADGDPFTQTNNLGLRGGYDFELDFIFDLTIKNFKVDYFRTGLEITNDYYFEGFMGHNVELNNFTKELELFAIPLKPLVIPVAGVFPIVVNAELISNIGASGDIEVEATIGSNRNVVHTMYVEYENNDWSSTYDKDIEDKNFTMELAGGIEFEAYAGVGVRFKLYNSNFAKSAINAEGYLKADAICSTATSNCHKNLRAGMRVAANIKMQAFGSSLLDFSQNLFDGSVVLIENELFSIQDNDDVFVGDIVLQTQEEVDDFGNNTYSVIHGSLAITGDDITDLSVLNTITYISGTLRAFNANGISNFAGLQNLDSIGYSLLIENSNNLISLAGLDNLTFIGSRLEIKNCSNLLEIENLKHLAADLAIIYISNNPSLTTINGIRNITEIRNIHIHDNQSLENLNGLENIISTDQLLIYRNENLTSISSLYNCNEITAVASIDENPKLEKLEGLEGLNNINFLFIKDNISLVDLCSLENLVQNGSITDSYNVSGNAYNPTIQDIQNGNCSQ